MSLKKVNKKQNRRKCILIAIIILFLFAIIFIVTNTNKTNKKAKLENALELGGLNIDITKVTSSNPNPPVVGAGMIPIKWNEEKNMWEITTKDDPDWYNYKDGKWANVMLSNR